MLLSTNIPTVLSFAGIILAFDLIVGGKLLFMVGEFLTKLSVTLFTFLLAIASKSTWLAELFCGKLWPVTVAIGVIVAVIILYDLRRLVKLLNRIDERRRGTRRKTPARY